jgi:hypothetical protein
MASVETANVGMFHHIRGREKICGTNLERPEHGENLLLAVTSSACATSEACASSIIHIRDVRGVSQRRGGRQAVRDWNWGRC